MNHRQARARADQERLAKLEEAQLASEETYSSLQQEAEQKGKKLKKLWSKYQQVKREVDDLNEELQREREDMLDSVRMLTHQARKHAQFRELFALFGTDEMLGLLDDCAVEATLVSPDGLEEPCH